MFNATRIVTTVAGTLVASAALTATLVAQQPAPAGTDLVRSLAGVWKAPEYKVAVSSDLDISVWGRGSSKVRNVELALEAAGTGILRVHNAVVDSRGRTRPYSASVVEARLELTPPAGVSNGSIEPVVRVVSAEERYLDGSNERRPIEGLTVRLNSLSLDYGLNLRFDTAQGTGSFGETLTRRGKAVTSASQPRAAGSTNRG